MAWSGRRVATTATGTHAPRRRASGADRGFTLVEMTTSVAVLLIVLTAAWLLLNASNANLNAIDYGGQASELNRATLASFERDLNRSVLPQEDVSPVLVATSRTISFMADVDQDNKPELVTWTADDTNHVLLRVVTRSTETTPDPTSVGDFAGGVTTTETVLTGLATQAEMSAPPLFSYAVDATTPYDPATDSLAVMRRIGLVTVHLRNGLPDRVTNVSDRTAAFRVIVLVINGYGAGVTAQ
jgi:prepilin-type N-terminal cleavage/methylation domain-containing protein